MRIHIPKVDASPPMIASPLELHSPLNLQNPFDGSAPTTTHQASYSPPIPPPTAPMTAPITTPSGATPPSQTAAQPPAISTSFPFPNPYDADGAAPTRFNHPYVPSLNDLSYDQEATDGSFFTVGGHSRENASAPFAPPPQFPNPYGARDVTPAQFNHPNSPSPNNLSHNRETADGSFFTVNGYSREYASAPFAPPQFPNPYGAHGVTPTQFRRRIISPTTEKQRMVVSSLLMVIQGKMLMPRSNLLRLRLVIAEITCFDHSYLRTLFLVPCYLHVYPFLFTKCM